MDSTTDARRITVPVPRPLPDSERISCPDAQPDWASLYPLARYAADHLRVLGKRIVEY